MYEWPQDGDPDPHAHNATPTWPIRTPGGVIEWVPEPNVFQSGLGDWLHKPTFLHNRAFSTKNRYLQAPPTSSPSGCVPDCGDGDGIPLLRPAFPSHSLTLLATVCMAGPEIQGLVYLRRHALPAHRRGLPHLPLV